MTTLPATAAAADNDSLPVRFTLETWIDGFFHRPAQPLFGATPDRAPVMAGERLSASLDRQLASWLSLGLDGHVVATQPDMVHGAFTEPGDRSQRARRADLTRLLLRAEGDGIDLVVGRGPLEVGLGDLYRPTDRFEPRNFANPLHTMRMGTWQATATMALGATGSLSLSLLPFDDRSAQPPSDSRWLGAIGDADFFAFPEFAVLADPAIISLANLTFDDRFRTRPEHWGYLAVVRSEQAGGDLFAGAHLGPGAFPVLEVRARAAPTLTGAPQITVTKVLPTAASLFAGGSLLLDRAKLTLEGIYQNTLHDRDDDFLRFAAGVTVRLDDVGEVLALRDLAFSTQYVREFVISRLRTPSFPIDPEPFRDASPSLLRVLVNLALRQPLDVRTSSESARTNRDTFLGEVRAALDARTVVRTRAAVNLDEGDRAGSVSLTYQFSDATTVETAFFWIDGPLGSQFGRFARNDGVFLAVTHRF